MSNADMLMGGVRLMVFGMGMVFLFLIIMIGAMKLLELALRPLVLRAQAAADAAKAKPAARPDDLKLAAIAAAAVRVMRGK